MTVSVKTQVLRFRIWAYANPRGWDVTMQDIADALGESMARVRSCIANTRGWGGRIRWTTDGVRGIETYQAGANRAGRHVAADIVAGRIGNEAGV
jgi:hypothetical protein